MAIYKPTDCVPSGQSFDALNNRPIFVECKIDTNNAIVNGYSLEFFDVENNRIFPEDSADIHNINHITLISDLKAFFDANFSAYGNGYTDLNTGINGSYIKIPILFNEDLPGNTFDNNVISDGLLLNGKKYRWKITLYQELGVSGGITYPTESKYYDMMITSGRVLGSTNERIQTALVADDEDLVSGLVLIDKYIQPVKISNLDYDPNFPKEWELGEGETIENTASRVLIENYDDIYGHIYPAKSGDNSFSQNDITPEVSNGFRIYKNGNNPENLGITDKVYEIINYQVDENVYGWEDKTITLPLTYLGSSQTTWPGSHYVYTNANGLIWANTQAGLSSYSIVSKQIVNGSATIIPDNKINNVSIEANGKINFLIDNDDDVPEYRIYYGYNDRNNTRFYQNLSIQIKLRKSIIVNQWQWINTPANPSQSYWEQTYTTTNDPTNGYYPFEQYSQSDINTMVFYGKERVIFNHMQTGGAYSGSGSSRIYYGSCYNGIFTPEASSKKVDGEDNKWDITIKWYRTTDANSWGQLLNKVVYVESGSTQAVESTDGNVNLSPGSNAEITIGSTAGVINQTPFLFVLEKPIRLFNTATEQTKSAEIIGSSDNIYVISLEVGSENISSIDNIIIGSVTIPRSEYAVIINTTKIIYTPSGSPVTGDINVTYVPYKEQDYTGVIFYNIDVAGKKGYSYIKPFVGIDDRMVFNINGSNNYVHIEEINTKYWFVYYSLFSFSLVNTDTPYQIRSCYRSGDLNEFGLYDDPRIPVKVYDSLGQEVELENGKYAYYIPTRAFSVEIEYEQDDYILWESCQWDLYTAEKRLDKFIARDFVTTTSEKYDGRLRFVFYGLDDKQYYILKATIVTNNGGKFNQDIILYANYGEASTGHDQSTINFNYDDLCVEIDIKESLTNPDQIKDSIIRVYKREIWYYQDEIRKPDGHFRGQHSPWRLIGENALSGCVFKDYCVASGHHYEYLICRDISVPEENDNQEQQTERWITKEQWAQYLEIDVKYTGWSIVELHNPRKIDNGRITLYDAEAKDVWRFKYNVSSGAQTQNLSKTQQDTLGLYPHISVGEKNFMSGSVSCLLGREIIQADYHVDHYKYVPESVVGLSEITDGYWTRNIDNDVYNAGGYKEELSRYLYPNYNNDYAPQYINADTLGFRNLTSNQAINMINAWKEVVYSGNNKLIRDEKGRMYIANILSNGINVNETWSDMPTEISFDWVEVGGTNQISVFENRAIGEITIDGRNPEDVDESGYIPAMRYSGFSGANKIIIENPQCIKGFGLDAFNGCENIFDVYIKYPEDLLPGEELEYTDLFDWWCTRDFVSQSSNPIHVSIGENGEGVRIFKQAVFDGEDELCSSIGQREADVFDGNYHCLNAIPSEYSVNGYKYLQDVGIDLDGLGDDNSNGSLPGGLFKGCTELTNVIIKNGNIGNDGVVGYGAFQDVESLQNVLMENIVIIGTKSFLGCSNLTSVEIPNTTTKIREGAFGRCVGLKELIIPGNVGYIYASAFSGCSQLSSLTLEHGISGIFEKAFAGCYNLKNIFVPASVSTVAFGAFSGCYGIEKITIPWVGGSGYIDEPQYIQDPFGYIFGDEYYTNSTKVSQEYYWGEEIVVSDYYIPSSLRSVVVTNGKILYGAFSNCSMLTSIELPDNISTIGGKAFIGCSNLMSVEIPSSVVNIGSYAFYESGLDTVYFENRANSLSIAFGAFAKCDISKVIYKGAVVNNNNVSIDGWFEIDFEDPTSNPVANSGNLYYTINEENEEYELYNLYVPNRDINNYALYKCKSLQSIEFSIGAHDTTTIGDYAFYDCSNVESINMSSAFIESIGKYAFYNMEYYFADGVESLILPSTIISLGESAFSNLGSRIGFIDNQNKLYINSCPDIGKNAFYNARISSVYYRQDELGGVEGWLYISFDNLYANPLYQFGADLYFYDPNQMEYMEVHEIEFPEGTSNIPKYAFAGSKLDIITFEDDNIGVSVGDYAFYNCSRLRGDGYESENLPSAIISVGKYSFAGTRISNIFNGLTNVDEGSFANSFVSEAHISSFTGDHLPVRLFDECSMLSVLELSRNTTSTESNALRGCIGIRTLLANVDIINSFEYKMNLTEITIYLNAPDQHSQQSIPNEMLKNSAALESVTIVGQDTYSHGHSIGKYAFANCSNLSELVLSDSCVYIIKEGAFGNSIISRVTIPDYVSTIEPEAFHTNRGAYSSFPASTWKLSKDGYSDVPMVITYNGEVQNPSEEDMATYLMGVDGHTGYTDRTWIKQ